MVAKRYVRYTIIAEVSREEPLEDFGIDEEWTDEGILEYISDERVDFLLDAVGPDDWYIFAKIVEREE